MNTLLRFISVNFLIWRLCLRLNHAIKIKQLFVFVENLLIVGFRLVRILTYDLVHQIFCLSQIKVLYQLSQTGHLINQVSHFMRFKVVLEIFKIIIEKLILVEVYLINLLLCWYYRNWYYFYFHFDKVYINHLNLDHQWDLIHMDYITILVQILLNHPNWKLKYLILDQYLLQLMEVS